MNIIVLMGGISGERNVSLSGGKSIFSSLKSLGHEVTAVDPALGKECIIDIENMLIPNEIPKEDELSKFETNNFIASISNTVFDKCDVVFNLVHGKWGEDGTLQALLDLKGVKYTGSGIRASSIAMNKIHSKMLFQAGGILTPEWAHFGKSEIEDYEKIQDVRDEFKGKLVIKPADQGSALGLTIIKDGNLDDIQKGLEKASKLTNNILVEEFIEGRELTATLINDEAYPLIEIIPHEGFYDYKNKYTSGNTDYICPADIDENVADFIINTADMANRLIGAKSFSRVDFRLNDDMQPFCLEVNTIPGFTSTSLVPMAAKVAGLEFPQLCEKICELAMK